MSREEDVYKRQVVSYIKYHDEGMLKRLGDKRSRIDIILDRIREQDAENMA